MKKRILTTPPDLKEDNAFIPVGNEFISLAELDIWGRVHRAGFLHMGSRSLLEFAGGDRPLVEAQLAVSGKPVSLEAAEISRDADWIPHFSLRQEGVQISARVFTPLSEKGFIYWLSAKNETKAPRNVRLGLTGKISELIRTVFTSRKLPLHLNAYFDNWTGSLTVEASSGLPLTALAVRPGENAELKYEMGDGAVYEVFRELTLKPGETDSLEVYFGINLDGDGAGTTTVHLARSGAQSLYDKQVAWLKARQCRIADRKLEQLLNQNLFFNYFFATGKTLDTGELTLVTSRSPRYYVSAAFWARDSLLWSFPALLLTDIALARQSLLTCFTRYFENASDHAQYLDGSKLYPGFELDELCAPFVALGHYLGETSDYPVAGEINVKQKALRFLASLEGHRSDTGLLRTFLDPSDDPPNYPYLTYDNMLFWKACTVISEVLKRCGDTEGAQQFAEQARTVREAIYEHCTVSGPFGRMFAWSVDLTGGFELYDNPPGSLQLLYHYGFCRKDDPVYEATLDWIFSDNNPYYYPGEPFPGTGGLHAKSPWILGYANDLLSQNRLGAGEILRRAALDYGLASETISSSTGKAKTGAAFATCAGFMAYALYERFCRRRPAE